MKARDVIAPLYAKARQAGAVWPGASTDPLLFAPEERRECSVGAVGRERDQDDARALVYRRVVVCARRTCDDHEADHFARPRHVTRERRPVRRVEPAGRDVRWAGQLLLGLTRTQALAAGAVPLPVDVLEDEDRRFLQRATDIDARPLAALRVVDVNLPAAELERRELRRDCPAANIGAAA